jgi:hypothetical protein
MNHHANRSPGAAVDPGGAPPADAPMQVQPWSEDAPHAVRADDGDARYRGELFLPGWLRIERQPTAEQGPGAA